MLGGGISLALLALINKENANFILLGAITSWFPDFLQFIGWKYDVHFLRKHIPSPGNNLYRISKLWIIIQILIVILSIIALLL